MDLFRVTKVIDLLSFLALVGMMASGFLIEYSLPPRSGGAEVWGLSRHGWGDVHYYLSLLFLALVSTHLVTHFRFIRKAVLGQVPGHQRYRVWIALAALMTLVLFVVLMFMAPVSAG